MSYTPRAQEYIDSVDGAAHQNAIEIIEAIEKDNDHLDKWIIKKCQENRALAKSRDKLLKALKRAFGILRIFDYPDKDYFYLEKVIEKTEAQKEKEI